jgi:hypothetical protein
VSTRTIRNRLDEAGLFGRVARISYPYTEEHIDKRLQFANDYAGWDGNDWSTVLFCDEAHIWLGELVRSGCKGPKIQHSLMSI